MIPTNFSSKYIETLVIIRKQILNVKEIFHKPS